MPPGAVPRRTIGGFWRWSQRVGLAEGIEGYGYKGANRSQEAIGRPGAMMLMLIGRALKSPANVP